MKRFMYYFATLLLVLAMTDLFLGGTVFGPGGGMPEGISASLNGLNRTDGRPGNKDETGEEEIKELGEFIAAKSCEFVRAAFRRDRDKVAGMLSEDTEYLISKDNSSYIRYVTENLHVEGYMATDKKLEVVRHNWYVIENDGTITSGVQVKIEGEKDFQTWYIHYRKSFDEWKVYMLENGI